MPEPEFVTVTEAAHALGLSERQVRRYAGRLGESDRLTPDTTTGASPARVRLSALAALAGKVIAEESAPEEVTGASPKVGTFVRPAPAGHDDRPPAESVRPMVSEDLAALREQLASVTAERDGLTARLADTASDRDAWKAQAQSLTGALDRALDEVRAARALPPRPTVQIEAAGLAESAHTGDMASGGGITPPSQAERPWWQFWRPKG